jgi:hypothetical protein
MSLELRSISYFPPEEDEEYITCNFCTRSNLLLKYQSRNTFTEKYKVKIFTFSSTDVSPGPITRICQFCMTTMFTDMMTHVK